MKKKSDSKFYVSFILASLLILSVSIITEASNNVNLVSDVKDFFIEAIKGNVAGTTTLNKFGENLLVGTVIEDIQTQGGVLVFLTSAEIINITSSSGNDDIVGTNARRVFIQGLDENFSQISETINMSGTSVSQTTKEYIRVFRMVVDEVGVYGVVNTGTISGTASSNGTTQIQIAAGGGQSQTTHYTVPKGKEAIIKSISITVDTGKVVTIDFVIRELANNTASSFKPHRHLQHWHGISAPIITESFGNKKFDEKTDIWFEGATSTGSSEVEINYDMILYDK